MSTLVECRPQIGLGHLVPVDPSVEALATTLLNRFFITDPDSLVGRLTSTPSRNNHQAVCQWLLQQSPWLADRTPTDDERRRFAIDFGASIRFIFL